MTVNDVCRRMYVKPRLEEDSHLELLRKSKTVLNNRQMFALKVKNPGKMKADKLTFLMFGVEEVVENHCHFFLLFAYGFLFILKNAVVIVSNKLLYLHVWTNLFYFPFHPKFFFQYILIANGFYIVNVELNKGTVRPDKIGLKVIPLGNPSWT